MGDAKKAVEKINWDPGQSDIGRGLGNVGKFGANLMLGGIPNAVEQSNRVEAEERHGGDVQQQMDSQAQEQDRFRQGLYQQNLNAERQKADKEKLDRSLLEDQSGLARSQSEEDAFIQARNAARKAKGNTLFQAWG